MFPTFPPRLSASALLSALLCPGTCLLPFVVIGGDGSLFVVAKKSNLLVLYAK